MPGRNPSQPPSPRGPTGRWPCNYRARVVQQGYARTGKTRLTHDRMQIIRQLVASLSEASAAPAARSSALSDLTDGISATRRSLFMASNKPESTRKSSRLALLVTADARYR